MGVASQAEGPYPACLADRTAAWPRGGADGGILHRSDYAGEGGDRMQRPVVQVFVGDEIQVQSERDFLAQVNTDLESAGQAAVILANFFTSSGARAGRLRDRN